MGRIRQRLAEQAFGRSGITQPREHEVDRGGGGIDGSVEVAPTPIDTNTGLIDTPGLMGWRDDGAAAPPVRDRSAGPSARLSWGPPSGPARRCSDASFRPNLTGHCDSRRLYGPEGGMETLTRTQAQKVIKTKSGLPGVGVFRRRIRTSCCFSLAVFCRTADSSQAARSSIWTIPMFTVVATPTRLSLDEHFIKRPATTFFVTVEGDGMDEQGIRAGDTLIDRNIDVVPYTRQDQSVDDPARRFVQWGGRGQGAAGRDPTVCAESLRRLEWAGGTSQPRAQAIASTKVRGKKARRKG